MGTSENPEESENRTVMAATATASNPAKTDEYGIERATADEPGAIDRMRARWGWLDHLVRMQERYAAYGGNQYAAGITYFSVLAVFPLLMMVAAIAAYVLAANPDTLYSIQERIAESVPGQMSGIVNQILETAIEQRGAVAGIGGLTALWSGLGWMNNLRYGVSKMWRLDPTDGNFVAKKLLDLVGLVGLLVAFSVAFGVTAIGSSGLTRTLLDAVGLGGIPGIGVIVGAVAIAVGVLANFLVFAWLIMYLPRTTVPVRSGLKAAFFGALAFEAIKQLGSLFFSNALANPAGATFGPIIGLMVLMYLIWRVLLYVSAWAATTEESRALTPVRAPEPAVIRVRAEVKDDSLSARAALGVGAAIGAAGAGLLGLIGKK